MITPEERYERGMKLLAEIRAESKTGVNTLHTLLSKVRKHLLKCYDSLRERLSPENQELLDELMDSQYVEGVLLRTQISHMAARADRGPTIVYPSP